MQIQKRGSAHDDLGQDWIIDCVKADKTLTRLYNKAFNYVMDDSKRITTLVNALFHLTTEAAQKGALSLVIHFSSVQDKNISILGEANHDETNCILAFFNKCLDIKVKQEIPYYALEASWEPSNLYLNTKPQYQAPQIQARESYFTHLLTTKEDSDVTFLVEGKEVTAHSLILKQSPYFKLLLSGQWKERAGSDIPIAFDGYSHKTFTGVLEYLYLGKLSATSLADCTSCIELWKLADYLQIKELVAICKAKIHEIINQDNFVSIAFLQMQTNDPELETLCKWFIRSHPDFADTVDLTSLKTGDLLTVYKVGKKYANLALVSAAFTQIKTALALDDSFILLCKEIQTTKEPELKRFLENSLRENNTLFEELTKGKKEAYKEHWKEYKQVMIYTLI